MHCVNRWPGVDQQTLDGEKYWVGSEMIVAEGNHFLESRDACETVNGIEEGI